MNLTTGQIIEFIARDGQISLGMVLQTSAKGVRVLQLNKREVTIPERSILHVGQIAHGSLNDLDSFLGELDSINSKRNGLMTDVKLEELHELLVAESRGFTFPEMMDCIGDSSDHDLSAALFRQLQGDSFFFKKKKDEYFPVSRKEVEENQQREKRRHEEEQSKTEMVEAIQEFVNKSITIPEDLLGKMAPALLEILLHENDAQVQKKFFEIVERSGLKNPRKLFQLLVRLGILDEDENLALRKHKVPVGFSEEVLGVVAEIIGCSEVSRPLDLSDLEVWVIDNPSTKDRDDGFSIRKEDDGSYHLWIHVSDAAEYVLPDSALDREARRRGTTLYFPDGNIPMLPPELSEAFLSLNQDARRCSLSQKIHVSPEGGILAHEFLEAQIHVTRAISYSEADEKIDHPDLAVAAELAKKFRRTRQNNGGLIMPPRPEGKISLENGEIHFELSGRESPSQEMVAEFMIWANHLAGVWCKERGIPCVYRVQDPLREEIEFGENFDPVVFFQMIRNLSRTQLSSNPGLHGCLGVTPYTQISSPIRRYGDLILQRQIKSALHGAAVLNQQDLLQVFMEAESAAGTGESIMWQRYRHFLIRYLKGKDRNTSTATIVEVGANECQFFLEELGEMGHCRKPKFEVKLGMRVLVRYSNLNDFDNIWRFEIDKELDSCADSAE